MAAWKEGDAVAPIAVAPVEMYPARAVIAGGEWWFDVVRLLDESLDEAVARTQRQLASLVYRWYAITVYPHEITIVFEDPTTSKE